MSRQSRGWFTPSPFSEQWVDLEKEAIVETDFQRPAGNVHTPPRAGEHPNLERIGERAEQVAEQLIERVRQSTKLVGEERSACHDLIYYVLYRRYRHDFDSLISQAAPLVSADFWSHFRQDFERFLAHPAVQPVTDVAHFFAYCFQVRRAFNAVFHCILGVSEPAANLRAEVWRSIFTHDFSRYFSILYDRMQHINTLIVGPSGSGKELVARALALSQYIAFDPKARRFQSDLATCFHPVNLAALAPTVIESELFGHAEGAFTGANHERIGWFEVCGSNATLFLDEIGELDPTIQVKLLRVLETRRFNRLGETDARPFFGKVVSATNRDLAKETRIGRFRPDLYYRLCADILCTPSLRELLNSNPEDLHHLVSAIAEREVGEEHAAELTEKVEDWISSHLDAKYPWPGNIRELEQCVRNVMIRGTYRSMPVEPAEAEKDRNAVIQNALQIAFEGRLSVNDLVKQYCRVARKNSRSHKEAVQWLGINWRTLKKYVEEPPPENERRSTPRRPR